MGFARRCTDMTRAEAFDAMRTLLLQLMYDAQKLAKQARNPAGRKAAEQRVTQIRDVLQAALEAT
jgi:hypothetical protein